MVTDLIENISRERVAILVKGRVETPSDISGMAHLSTEAAG
jgi:predicted nucleotide-binding protein